jgi:hypothetical protein
MKALCDFSRIRWLTTRSIYSEGQKKDDIAILKGGNYNFYGKSGYLGLKDSKLVSAVNPLKTFIKTIHV